MKTIFKTALILGLASFALFANAQTLGTTATTPGSATTQPVAQTDFVTVGSTMPYATNLNQSDFNDWRNNALDWGFTIPANVQNTASWRVRPLDPDGPFVPLVENENEILITWPATQGQFEIMMSNRIMIGNVSACDSAVSLKRVFVLPFPTVLTDPATIAGHGAVLHCDSTSHTVTFTTRGIGERQVRYVVTRRAIDATDSPDPVAQEIVGTAQTTASWFETSSFATALRQYETADGNQVVSIQVTGLQAGFIYRVHVVGINDQISRKSFAGDASFGPADVQAVFAVVPRPTSTTIDHVGNH